MPAGVLQEISQLPKCLACHGWPVRTPQVDRLVEALLLIEVPPHHEVQVPVNQDRLHLFTDGACSSPDDPVLRLAAWAVTASSGLGDYASVLLHAGHVPGVIQSAFRAELWAVWSAIHYVVTKGVCATIWCDNEAIVTSLRRMLGSSSPRKLRRNHRDLWSMISRLITRLTPGQLQLCQVVAHGDLEKATSALEHWCFFHNGIVDRSAVKANALRSPLFMQRWQEAADAVAHHRVVSQHVL